MALSAALAKSPDTRCAGLILTNMAAAMAINGRIAEAETFAERSLALLEKSHGPGDLVLLRPLQILAATRFEQGKTARAREVFQRMRQVRIERPEDAALVHGTAAILFQSEGRLPEAEREYLAAIRAWEEAGLGNTADAGAVLNCLATLYVLDGRFDNARQTLDRALAVFMRAKEAVPTDFVKLLSTRAGLHFWRGEWREAEQDLYEAVSIADREPLITPDARAILLSAYARVLRKNHKRREARPIEARLAILRAGGATGATGIVDVTELRAEPKRAKKCREPASESSATCPVYPAASK